MCDWRQLFNWEFFQFTASLKAPLKYTPNVVLVRALLLACRWLSDMSSHGPSSACECRETENVSSSYFFFWLCHLGSQLPNQGLNLGSGSESPFTALNSSLAAVNVKSFNSFKLTHYY